MCSWTLPRPSDALRRQFLVPLRTGSRTLTYKCYPNGPSCALHLSVRVAKANGRFPLGQQSKWRRRPPMQNKPHLIGERRTTGSAVRRQLALVQFDQIFHLSARAIERVVDMFGRAIGDLGDDVADIQPQFRCFDARADATLDFPGFGSVVRLRVASQDRCLFLRATGADIVGLVFDGGGENLVAGQPENVNRGRCPRTNPSPRCGHNGCRPEW